MGTILKVDGTEIRKDAKGLIACILLREVMTGIWVEKITKGDSEHKLGSYQIVRPTRGNKQKVIAAVEAIVNGCSGLDRNIAYMEINSIWNHKKCFDEINALEERLAKLNAGEFKVLAEFKEKARVCVDLIDSLSAQKGIMKYIKLIVATVKFAKCGKKFGKLVKDIFEKSSLHVELELFYNLKDNVVEMDVVTNNTVVTAVDVNKEVEGI